MAILIGKEYTEYRTKQQLLDWANSLPDNVKLCPECFTELIESSYDGDKIIYCPNEMCLNDDTYGRYGNSFDL